jgi:hypothetical protein
MGEVITVNSRKHGERAFEYVRSVPYQRQKDRKEMSLFVWLGKCVVCGAPFETTTPRRNSRPRAFGVTTCPEHRRPRTVRPPD